MGKSTVLFSQISPDAMYKRKMVGVNFTEEFSLVYYSSDAKITKIYRFNYNFKKSSLLNNSAHCTVTLE